MKNLRSNIIQSIAYFDIFNHPLQLNEVGNLCGVELNNKTLAFTLNQLVESNICYINKGYYSLQAKVEQLVSERKAKEKEAKAYFKKLPFYVKLLRLFPFVRGIAISGSLSKNVMHEDGDIDYFIISAPGRLWICRTLIVLFKKTVLLNSKKYFCVNYFVDAKNLEIIDKNIFTAVEINFLLAVYNHELIDKMKIANGWTKSYFPQFTHPLKSKDYNSKKIVKPFIERLFTGSWGDKLDLYLMKKTHARWSSKFKHFDSSTLELTMRSNRGISKHHPRDFQTKVLTEFENKLSKLNIEL